MSKFIEDVAKGTVPPEYQGVKRMLSALVTLTFDSEEIICTWGSDLDDDSTVFNMVCDKKTKLSKEQLEKIGELSEQITKVLL